MIVEAVWTENHISGLSFAKS